MEILHDVFLYQVFVTLFVVIDPIAIAPIFLSLTAKESEAYKRRVIKKACFIAIGLLIFFAVAGEYLLEILEISEPAFRITGGVLLLIIGINMVISHESYTKNQSADEAQEAIDRHDISVFPLAIPLIAGPGGMASVVVLMHEAQETSWIAQMYVLLSIVLVIFLVYISMRYGSRIIMKYLGVTGVHVLTRVFGVILSALAIQSLLTGVVDTVKLYF